jgi:hypothetical protein
LANLLHRFSQAMVRSAIHHFGKSVKALAVSDRFYDLKG